MISLLRSLGLVGLATACAGLSPDGPGPVAEAEGHDTQGVVAALADSSHDDECVRATPEPVLDPRVPAVRAHTFELRGDGAMETAELGNGIPITITHSGCAHYALELVFIVDGEHRDLADVAFWLGRAAGLLQWMDDHEASKLDMASKVDAVRRVRSSGNYAYGAGIEIIEGFSFIYVSASSASSARTRLAVTYEVIL